VEWSLAGPEIVLSIVGHFDDGVYGVRLPSSSGLMLVELRIAIDLQAQWQVGIWVTRLDSS